MTGSPGTPVASLAERVAPIAAALGTGWTATPGKDDTTALLLGPDGMRLEVTEDTWHKALRGKLTIAPCVDDDLAPHRPHSCTVRAITVTQTRPPAHLAADITRRILGDYRELLRLARLRRADDDAVQLAREELIAQLLAALGPTAAVHDALNGRRRILYPHRPAVDLSMDVPTGQRRIEVTLTIPKRLGVELCDFLRGHAEAQPPPIACRLCQAPHYADELVPASGHCPSCAPEAHHRLRM